MSYRYENLMIFAALILVFTANFPIARAAEEAARTSVIDDFGGDRFNRNSHSALSESPGRDLDTLAESLSGIEPAAGSVSPEEESRAGSELEGEYGTPVSHTVIDRGDHETIIRDRVGAGEVGIFYENKQDGRINDNHDAIGVELKVLEFN